MRSVEKKERDVSKIGGGKNIVGINFTKFTMTSRKKVYTLFALFVEEEVVVSVAHRAF